MKKSRSEMHMEIFDRRNYVRVAAVLGKTHAARCMHPENIAQDAIALERLIRQTRDAMVAKKATDRLASKARELAERYDAEIVQETYRGETFFGLRFLDGSCADMGRGLFRVC